MGGAERVASLLCNFWAERGHEVGVITFERGGTAPAYSLSSEVTLRYIDALNVSQNPLSRLATNARRVSRLRSLFKELKPDVIVSFTTEANVVALWSAIGLGVPVVVSERNQPDRPSLGPLRRLARRLTYPSAAALVLQSDAVADWARSRFRVPVHILPNPIQLERWRASPEMQPRGRRVVAAGRLVPQKGFDLLIESFARLKDKHPEWSLAIFGEGAERAALEAQILRLSLLGRVTLPGATRDLAGALGRADLFVLPSRYEGFPNVLIEALAAGKAVVATDCPGATRQILGGGRYGMLVEAESVENLTEALDQMMSDEASRTQLAHRAREAVAEFDIEAVGGRWLSLLSEVQPGSNGA